MKTLTNYALDIKNFAKLASFTGLAILSSYCSSATPTGPSAPPPAASCTYTYSEWNPGVCPTTGRQTRNVLSSTPNSCSGTPVLEQSCTYVPNSSATVTLNKRIPGEGLKGTLTKTIGANGTIDVCVSDLNLQNIDPMRLTVRAASTNRLGAYKGFDNDGCVNVSANPGEELDVFAYKSNIFNPNGIQIDYSLLDVDIPNKRFGARIAFSRDSTYTRGTDDHAGPEAPILAVIEQFNRALTLPEGIKLGSITKVPERGDVSVQYLSSIPCGAHDATRIFLSVPNCNQINVPLERVIAEELFETKFQIIDANKDRTGTDFVRDNSGLNDVGVASIRFIATKDIRQ